MTGGVARERDSRNWVVLNGLSHAFGSAPDFEEMAGAAARWVRTAVGPGAGLLIALPDRAGRLRVAWKDGEGADVGRKRSVRRRVAFARKIVIRVNIAGAEGRALVIFPLVCRGLPIGVLEVVASRRDLEAGWEAVEAVASQVAITLRNQSEQKRLRREIETLERAASLGRDLFHAKHPSEAIRGAARFLAERFEVPVSGWLVGDGSGDLVLTTSHGLGTRKRRELGKAMGMLPHWESMLSSERDALTERFGEVVGADEVAVVNVGDALLLAGYANPRLRASIEEVGTLLGTVLRHLAVTARAKRRNEQLDLGLAWMAHELRAPLLGIKAVLELQLSSQPGGPVSDALLRRSLRELEQLAGTTEGLLGWAVGARPLRRRQADLVKVVGGAIESCWLESGEDRVLVFAPPRVVARVDPVHLRVAIANILRNALALSEPGSKIEIAVTERAGLGSVSVTNVGPIIPSSERETIFDPFVRGRLSAASRGASGGLGLFIARRVVEAHGGRIWVDSDERGTTFHLQVPIGAEPARRFAS